MTKTEKEISDRIAIDGCFKLSKSKIQAARKMEQESLVRIYELHDELWVKASSQEVRTEFEDEI